LYVLDKQSGFVYLKLTVAWQEIFVSPCDKIHYSRLRYIIADGVTVFLARLDKELEFFAAYLKLNKGVSLKIVRQM